MRTVDEHVAAALALAPDPAPVEVALADALGLVTARPVVALTDAPPFDNSAMDGFAVRWADVAGLAGGSDGADVTLRIAGESRAGVPASMEVAPGHAIRIMTGAAMPRGADTVIPLEVASEDGGGVTVREAGAQGAFVRARGGDARAGDTVIPAGVELGARHLAAAATVGVASVEAFRRPRVGILSTGDELAAPGTELAEGQIYDANGVLVASAVRTAGGEPVHLGSVRDDAAAVFSALEATGADIVITTGGVSVGAYDVVKEALAGRGVEFLSVAMQPGKPQGLGVVNGLPVVCLPGNPVSVAVCFELFVEPMLRAMRGLAPHRQWERATAGAGWASPPAREQFMPVRVVTQAAEGHEVVPATDGGSGSHLITRLALADGLARVPAATTEVRAGDSLWFRRFTP